MQAWVAALLVAAPVAEARELARFDIPAQRLEDALIALATQAHISVALPAEGMGEARSKALVGGYAVDDALAALLARSGYEFRRVGAGAYRIVLVPRDEPAHATTFQSSDVIVISARRPTALGALPRTVTHLRGADLADVRSDSTLAASVGGLSFTNLGQGRNKIVVRGISDGALAGQAQSLVGLYFGDTRITYAAPDPDLQLVDIKSVDVLGGPQGALYGAGAIGGIVRIEPNDVDLNAFMGSAALSGETTRGGGAGRDVELIVNAPLIADAFGARAVLYDESAAGWLDNARLGLANTNETRRHGGRLQIRAEIAPDWSVTTGATIQKIDGGDSQYLQVTAQGLQRTPALLEPHDNDFALFTGVVRGRTRWGDLTSSTSIVNHEIRSRFDATGAFASLAIAPASPASVDETDSLSILVHETRLTAPDGADRPWFAGLFYADGDNSRDTAVRDTGAPVYAEHRVDNVDEIAAFGAVTWRLAPTVSLDTGLRLFRSSVSTHSTSVAPASAGVGAFAGRLVSTGAAPDVRLSWQPSRRLLFFVAAAEGYRSGGFNTGGPASSFATTAQPFRRYAGDEIWTYELGARAALLDDRLDVQATLFANDWRGVLSDSVRANGFTYSGAVGDARAYGLEFDVRYAPSEALTFQAHGLVNEPEIAKVDRTTTQAAAGGLPGAPEFSGGASARYERPFTLDGRRANLFGEIGAVYTGASTLGFGRGARIGDYTETRLSAGIETDRWRATLSVDNLGDSHGATFTAGNPYLDGATLVTPLRPRTIGVSVKRSF